MTPAAARARVRARWSTGTLVTLAVLVLVAMSVLVVSRRGRGMKETAAIAQLELDERDLAAQIARLEVELAKATSWARIGPAAERRLGLRQATDAQLVTLSRAATPELRPDTL